MITTPLKVLQAVSDRFNENEVDTSAKRVRIFNQAMHKLLAMYKWEWAKKLSNLAVTAGDEDYVLTTAISDYDLMWGIDSVEFAGQIFPVEYEDRNAFITAHFALEPDKKTIIFTKAFEANGTVPIWYYARHVDVETSGATLNISVPESALAALVLYMKHIIHDGKRQRNDARNAILDFQEVIEEMTIQNATTKAKNLTKTRRNPLQYAGFQRKYANH